MTAAALILAGCGGTMPAPIDETMSTPSTTTEATAEPAAPTYRLAGTVSGLSDSRTLVLQANGQTVTASANGSFQFDSTWAAGASYAVSIVQQPLWQFCSLSGGTGQVSADVTSIAVSCVNALATVTTFAGSGGGSSVDGQGPAADFSAPFSLATTSDGVVAIADLYTSLIRKMTPGGDVTTLAGTRTAAYQDGNGTAASFAYPYGVAVGPGDVIYVADSNNQRIRKITPDGEVSTVAGSGNAGADNGPASSATFNFPIAVAAATDGTLYVADNSNNIIRKISPQGDVSTLAGTGVFGSTDGPGSSATVSNPTGLAMAPDGSIIVADTGNHQVRRITPDGVVSTLAGNGSPGYADGTGTAARFDGPYAVAVDRDGMIYVTDNSNQRIRMITPAGVVTTLAGSGTAGDTDGIGTQATFNSPVGITVTHDGMLYVSDLGNLMIRRITPTAP